MEQAVQATAAQQSRVGEGRETVAAWSLSLAMLRHLVGAGTVTHADAVSLLGEALQTIREVLPDYRASAALLEYEQAMWERESAAKH
jgi:hypothetical protein